MNNENELGWLMVILIGGVIYLWFQVSDLKKQVKAREDMISDCNETINLANGRINDSNDEIESAQGDAWSDYNTMGETLANLNTTEQVYNNCVIPTDKK